MKKKLKIAVSVVGIILLLLTCGILWMAKNGVDISTGTCLIADNGRYMIIIDNSPIAMSIRSGDGTLFDGLETGDEILIIHDGIAESYPGRTGVYFCAKLDKGNEIPESVVKELAELRWIVADAEDSFLQEPPELTISSGGNKVTALKGTYSWNYQNPDGTGTGIESDSMHPLESKEYMPQLPITYVENSNVYPFYAVLRFDTDPDEINILYWTEDCWNDVSAKSQEVKVRPTEVMLENGSRAVKQFNISLERESCIYEVTAKWNSSEQYGGTAHYSFYTVIKEDDLFLQFLNDEIPIINYPTGWDEEIGTIYETVHFSDIEKRGIDPESFIMVDMDGDGEQEFSYQLVVERDIIKYNEEKNCFELWLRTNYKNIPVGNGQMYSVDYSTGPRYGYYFYDEYANLISEKNYCIEWKEDENRNEYPLYYIWKEQDGEDGCWTEVSKEVWEAETEYLFELMESAPEPFSYKDFVI